MPKAASMSIYKKWHTVNLEIIVVKIFSLLIEATKIKIMKLNVYVHASMRYGVFPTKIWKFFQRKFHYVKISGFTVIMQTSRCLLIAYYIYWHFNLCAMWSVHVMYAALRLTIINGHSWLSWFIEFGEEVKSGDIEIHLKGGLIPFDDKLDLCKAVQKAGDSCPLEPGKHTLTVSMPIPSIAPKVTYILSLNKELWHRYYRHVHVVYI